MQAALATIALVGIPFGAAAQDAASAPSTGHPSEIRTDDVDRFYRAYDAAQGKPTPAFLQSQYLDPGSQALHQFTVSRNVTPIDLAHAISVWPQAYADARSCSQALPELKSRMPAVFAKLSALYPPATFPPVTFLIGRNDTGGSTTLSGVVIGLEAACRQTWTNPDVTERFVHLVSHEYVHVQQKWGTRDAPPDATLLFQSLLEGGAEFVGELSSGEVANLHLKSWTRGQECRIERAFRKDAFGTDLSRWLYNGTGTPDEPGDLGYWVGYRIAKAYYARAVDKTQAIAALMDVDNVTAGVILTHSGWTPESDCEAAAAA